MVFGFANFFNFPNLGWAPRIRKIKRSTKRRRKARRVNAQPPLRDETSLTKRGKLIEKMREVNQKKTEGRDQKSHERCGFF